MSCRNAAAGPGNRGSATIKIGLLIPLQGVAGIWGPSSEACARLAAAELNARSGILNKAVDLVVIDSGAPRADVARALRTAMREDRIGALVGMHPSDLRAFVTATIDSDLPYVYTPLYEGGERSANVFAIGQTPDRLLGPGIRWLTDYRGAETWFLIGNDYVWPRMTHEVARDLIGRNGGRIVGERYFPFGMQDFAPLLDALRARAPDVVLLSVIGDDAVRFNRAFAEAGLAARAARFSTAVEENVLYGIGPDNTENMVLTAGYFAHVRSAENDLFRERYHSHFGESPPMQNDLGESCYEGLHCLGALAEASGSLSAKAFRRCLGARHGRLELRRTGRSSARSGIVHLAAVDGVELKSLEPT